MNGTIAISKETVREEGRKAGNSTVQICFGAIMGVTTLYGLWAAASILCRVMAG